jgi:hypothetical protein
MESTTTSSASLVQTRLMRMIENIETPEITDEKIAQEIEEYFDEHGGSGSIAGFVYDRNSIVAATWIIDHNLNRYPQVTLIDDTGAMFEADIFYNSLNQVTVSFAQPTSGKAVLI